jgi:hypothetical protein
MLVIPELRRLKQDNQVFNASLEQQQKKKKILERA